MEEGQAEEVDAGAGVAAQQLPKAAAEAGAPSDAAVLAKHCLAVGMAAGLARVN